MATGGDVVLQLLRELRDLEQQVRAEYGRTEERLTQLQGHVETLVQGVAGLTDSFRTTKELHEKHFDKLGRTVNVLADQQLQDRETLDNHERRISALEQA